MKKSVYCGTVWLVIVTAMVIGISALWQSPALALTALEEKLYQAALKERELNWWDQNSLSEASAFIKEFNNRYPGIKINYFEGNQEQITERYLAEYKAGRATADTVQPEPYEPFQKGDLLLNMSDIIQDAKYPVKFATKEMTGATLTHGIHGIGYNTKLVAAKDLPQSWEDLLNPKWRGKINMEERLKVFIYGTEHWGEEWVVNYLKKLREQKLTYTNGYTQNATLLNAGEFPIAIGIHLHRTLVLQAKKASVGFLLLKPAIHVGASPHSIPKTAPHPNAAKLFYRWWMSPEGQLVNDKIRFRGNPLPGAGTSQAKFLEQHDVPVFSCTMWAIENMDRLEKKYAEALGYKK